MKPVFSTFSLLVGVFCELVKEDKESREMGMKGKCFPNAETGVSQGTAVFPRLGWTGWRRKFVWVNMREKVSPVR